MQLSWKFIELKNISIAISISKDDNSVLSSYIKKYKLNIDVETIFQSIEKFHEWIWHSTIKYIKYKWNRFWIKCERSRLMIILIIKQSLSRITDSNNREYIIFVEVINVVDNIIILFLIFKKVFIAHRLIVNDLN